HELCSFSLHDALPISSWVASGNRRRCRRERARAKSMSEGYSRYRRVSERGTYLPPSLAVTFSASAIVNATSMVSSVSTRVPLSRSEEHTSELQSRENL